MQRLLKRRYGEVQCPGLIPAADFRKMINEIPAEPRLASPVVDEILKHLKLRHLRTAIEVARTGSVRATADLMCVTDPAISKTLRELEELLGVRLFERTKKGMALTDIGRQFTNYAQSAVDALQSGVILAVGQRHGHTGSIKLGAMAVVTATLLPEVMRLFVDGNGGVVIEIVSGSATVLLERLRAGYVALVIGRCPAHGEMTGLSFEQLYSDHHTFVVRSGHPLAGQTELPFEEVSNYPFVMPPRASMMWEEIQQHFVARGVKPKATKLEVVDLQFSREYTATSDAIWLASERAVKAELAAGKFVRLPFDSSRFDAPIGVITSKSARPSAEVKRLIALLRDTGVRAEQPD